MDETPQRIAIIGVACRLPGANDPDAFWQLLRSGTNAVGEVPADRWDAAALYEPTPGMAGKMNTHWGGFLPDIDFFDARFFEISRGEASSMDPQQRLLLEVTWEALENAAIPVEKVRGTRTGVFVGISGSDHASICNGDLEKITAYSLIGNHLSIAPNRVSNFFDFHGPSFAVDTACSSSLLAVHLACQSLRSGESTLAVAGGVNVILTPNATVAMSHAWILSSEGKCKPFDRDADGYVRGEGCGILILKRLTDALKNGDIIHAVIRASAVNQDGRGPGLTVPNLAAQQKVIEEALAGAGVLPHEIGYVEAHGIGSRLTDAVEIQALQSAFGAGSSSGPHCSIGSVKGNIGHLEPAAGVAAMIKTIYCLRYGEIPPTLHLKNLSPDVAQNSFGFVVPTSLEPWPATNAGRIAGVNAFGIGGTNVHVVLQEAPPSRCSSAGGLHILTLSAKSERALREMADRYAAFLVMGPDASLGDVCFTSNVGRSQFSIRCAIVADSLPGLVEALKLDSLLGGALLVADTLDGDRSERLEAVLAIGNRYVHGDDIDWAEFHKNDDFKKVALPAYPFQREKYSVRDRGAIPATSPPALQSELQLKLNAAPQGQRELVLLDHVRNEVASVLGLAAPSDIDVSQGFFEMGMTSLMAIELHRRLLTSLGSAAVFPTTAVFDFSNVESLAGYLAGTSSSSGETVKPRLTGPLKEPIAIIGMGCRLPGADTPEAFWQLLREGVDAIREVPPERWNIDAYYDPNPDAAGKMYTRWGGFLDHIDGFDAQFFGIAPREAISMDPQQRLLLEVAWEAVENAGLAAGALHNSRTGVFAGVGQHEYAEILATAVNASDVDAHHVTGSLLSAIAGRVSHVLGLTGPALAVDTACSSSLVTVHLACQSLRSGECDLALAGGVGLLLLPESTVRLCQTKALSPDGRCKSFDASASGYTRGEGCGIVVLKRLSEALADHDNILALIRGSAVNHDGASSGFTVPNGLAQRAVLRSALADAEIEPARVSFVEAHGTGTPLGDPIEIHALTDVFAKGRTQPLVVSSVKANIGHLEPAAGIAGLIKAVLALQHKELPAHLHLKTLNPHIDFGGAPVTIPAERMPWHSAGHPRIAGVSAFGFSGTNAHVILEEASHSDEPAVPRAPGRPLHLLALSGRNTPALKDLVLRYVEYLTAHPSEELADIAFTANTGRQHFSKRVAVVASSVAETREQLSAFHEGIAAPGVFANETVKAKLSRIAFLFTGQGSQFAGMGRVLYDTQPSFRNTLQRCDELLRPYLNESLLSVLYPAAAESSPIGETAYTQPALFALEYALAELWRSWGIVPAAVMGHSVGEYVAACVAGVLTLEDALKLVAVRGRLMQALPAGGAMAAVLADEQRVRHEIERFPALSIAAVNGPDNVVISGRGRDIDAVSAQLETRGVRVQRLAVSHAFHSQLMEPMLGELEQLVGEIDLREPRLELIGNLTGSVVRPEEIRKPESWRRHARETVRFSTGVETLVRNGYHTFLEIGPTPTLSTMGRACVTEPALWLASLRRGKDDWQQMLESLSMLYIHGCDIDWRGFDRDYLGDDSRGRRKLALPSYPFQRRRYWPQATSRGRKTPPVTDPFLGQRLQSPLKDIQFATEWSEHSPAFLQDHRIYDTVVVPAAAHVALVIGALRTTFADRSYSLESLMFHEPLAFRSRENRSVQLIFTPQNESAWSFQILSLDEESWTVHASGRILFVDSPADDEPPAETPPHVIGDSTLGSAYYERVSESGLQLGASFQWIERLSHHDDRVLGQMRLPTDDEADPYFLHPGLVDSWFQLAGALIPSDGQPSVWVPIGIDRLQVYRQPHSASVCHARLNHSDVEANATLSVNLHVVDSTGRRIADIEGLHIRRSPRDLLMRARRQSFSKWLYHLEWERSDHPRTNQPKSPGAWLVLSDGGGVSDWLAEAASACGDRWIVVPNVATVGDLLARPEFRPCHGVVYLPTLGGREEPIAADGLETALHLVQLLAKSGLPEEGRLWLIANGATNAKNASPRVGLASAPLWGLANVIRIEQPRLFGGTALLREPSRDDAFALFQQMRQPDGEQHVAFSGGHRYVARLVRSGSIQRKQSARFLSDGTYLITGGLGALGLRLAQWMVERNARHLVLVGRRAATNEAARVIRTLEETGARIKVIQADVSVEEDVSRVVHTISSTMPALRGIIHAAGVIDDGVLTEQTWGRFTQVMAPKVKGAWNLHKQTRGLNLDFFVLFSSIASVLGSPAQANYAAANAFLDALAHQRRTEGLPALSINWGPWADDGMAARNARTGWWQSRGVDDIDPQIALDIFDQLLQNDLVQPVVLQADWQKLLGQSAAVSVPPLLSRIIVERPAPTRSERRVLLQLLEQAPTEQRDHVLIGYVRDLAARVLAFDPSEPLDTNQPLSEMGLDSLMALDLTKALSEAADASLPATLLFNYPTIEAVARYVSEKVFSPVPVESKKASENGGSERAAAEEQIRDLSQTELEVMLDEELASLDELLGS
jgi:acyl transferase domain-containing protein/acyl carrier protein